MQRRRASGLLHKTLLQGTQSTARIKEVFIESKMDFLQHFRDMWRDLYAGKKRPPDSSKVRLEEKLVVVWDSGKRLELFGVKSYQQGDGELGFNPADIQSVILTDSNGDGEVDFIVHAGNDEHVLIETKNQEIKSRHVLENAQPNPFGC